MTMPLLLSEILQMDELTKYEHTSTLVQWLSSDQAEECPLHWILSNIPRQSPKLITELRWNWTNDISSDQMI